MFHSHDHDCMLLWHRLQWVHQAGWLWLAEGFQAMKLPQNKIRWLARLMLALVLFAQGIVAASACLTPDAGPVQAYAAAQDDEAAPCHDEEFHNSNACLAHCTQADQAGVDLHILQFAAPAGVIGWLSNQPQAEAVRQNVAVGQIAPDTGPPLPIRFCSFLN